MGVEMDRHAHSNRNRLPCAIALGEFDALLTSACAPAEASAADDLLDWIEDSDGTARFILDWEGETFKNAA
jgi:hypothetical protein